MECARGLADAGVRLLQYRNKTASTRKLYDSALALATALVPRGVTFLVNDRADLARLCGASGVHLGQQDLSPQAARALLGDQALVGVSTHNLQEFQRAVESSADYIAVGPVYSTRTKADPDPVIGVDFVRQVRPLTKKPIVAIGGITLDRAEDLIRAGADSVAVISDILLAKDPAERAGQYLKVLGGENQATVA
jgi:thiamine-phosphate pyrophosphorylase